MKSVEGWLCRDGNGEVEFFSNGPDSLWQTPGRWWERDRNPDRCWSPEDFLAEYNLTDDGTPCALPKPGRKFLVTMQMD